MASSIGDQPSELHPRNGSNDFTLDFYKPLEQVIPVGIILCIMILTTVAGNILVVMAVVRERKLHQLANKLVTSLAITDLMVGLLVLPLAAVYSIMDRWPFGSVMCEIFISTDMILCTSSILHLAAIAVDRHWTVTDVTYTRGGSPKNQYFLPVAVPAAWLVSIIVYVPRWFFQKTEEELPPGVCRTSQSKTYTIYSTLCAFYIPMLIIIAIYTKIFLIVRARTKRDRLKDKSKSGSVISHADPRKRLLGRNETSVQSTSIKSTDTNKQCEQEDSIQWSDSSNENTNVAPHVYESVVKFHENGSKQKTRTIVKTANDSNSKQNAGKHVRKNLAQKRERKALRTLLIITGIFIICWLPFFTFEIIMPFCGRWCESRIPTVILQMANWFGYSNSMLNPIIYTIFSPDFRRAFRKILFFRC